MTFYTSLINRPFWMLLLLLAACGDVQAETTLVSSRGVRVDAVFEESYLALGGQRTLGEPITVAYTPEANGR